MPGVIKAKQIRKYLHKRGIPFISNKIIDVADSFILDDRHLKEEEKAQLIKWGFENYYETQNGYWIIWGPK